MNVKDLFRINLIIYNFLLTFKIVGEKIINFKYLRLRKKNINLIKYKKSDVCYVLGNGPSLNNYKDKYLDGDVIVVNDFFRIENSKINPTFYIVSDAGYSLKKLEGRLNSIINYRKDIPHIYSSKLAKTVLEKDENNNLSFFFNPFGHLYSSKKKYDFSKTLSRSWNVVNYAILFAMYLGYKEIRLIGVDLTLISGKKGNHFYRDNDHEVFEHLFLPTLIVYTYTVSVHYEIAKRAIKDKIRIVNYSDESLLDAYEFKKENE